MRVRVQGGAHRASRIPAVVRAALLAHLAVLLLSVFAWPVHRAPDEPQHLDLVLAVASRTAVPWPDPGRLRQSTGGAAADRLYPRGDPVFTAADAPGRWPSWASAGGATPGRSPNWMVQHPPLYYLGVGVPLSLLPGWPDLPYDVLLDLVRLVGALLLLPLPLLAWAAARRLTGDGPVASAAAVTMLAVPHVQHIGASANNDSLLILLMAGVTVPLAGVLRGDTRWRTAGLVGALTGLALLTKGTALVLPPVLGLAYLLAARRAGLLRALGPALLAAGLAVGLGGWWWVRNKLRYGVLQPNGLLSDQSVLDRRPPVTSAADSGLRFLGVFARRVTGNLWLEPAVRPRPAFVSWTSWGLSVLAVVLLLVGVLAAVRARGPERLRVAEVAWLLLPAAGILGIVLSGSWAAWRTSLQPAGQQGRYLYPALVGLALLAVLGVHRLVGDRLVLVVSAVAAALQAVMGAVVLTQSWLPRTGGELPSRLAAAWRGWDAWSPLPWPVLALLVLAAAAALVRLVLVAVGTLPRPAPPEPPPGRTRDPAPHAPGTVLVGRPVMRHATGAPYRAGARAGPAGRRRRYRGR